jgi:hypothetical protein
VDKYENVGVTAMGKFMFPLVDYAAAMPLEVERRTLTPPDPQLKSAWYPGGFNPCTYQVKTRFPKCAFQKKCNVHRYVEVKCSVLTDNALFSALSDNRAPHGAHVFGARGSLTETEWGRVRERRGARGQEEEEEEEEAAVAAPAAAAAAAEVGVAGSDWISELILWARERRRGKRGPYKEGDTSVSPDDVRAFTREHFSKLFHKAGFRRRIINRRYVVVLTRPDGVEEPAYLATRKLPLTLPDANEEL